MVSAVWWASQRRSTASSLPCGAWRTALCSRLRVNSRSIHSWARTGAASVWMPKSRSRWAIRGEISSATVRSTSSSRVMGGSLCWRNCSTLASASIWLASCVARSTVSLISCRACSAGMSPRRADCTWVLSTASGVRNWCDASRTNRFWWRSRWRSRCITWLVAAISGCNSRGAVGAAMGLKSPSPRACSCRLRCRTGRVARCTTHSTVKAITAISRAWRIRVFHRICSARVSRTSSVSATWITAMPRPSALATGCSSTATRTGWSRKTSS